MRCSLWIAMAAVILAAGCGETAEGYDVGDDASNVTDEAVDVTDEAVDTTDDAVDEVPVRVACLRDPDCRTVMVAAHRGLHLTAPENSLAAMRAAAVLGADFVEIDVRDTKDGGLVVMHDSNVATSTDGTGQVPDLTTAEIRALTLQGATDDPESQRVPLFSEALALASELGIMIYLDAKSDRYDLMVAEIAAGPYYDVVLYRDEWVVARQVVALDPRVMIMPPVPITTGGDPVADAATMKNECPNLNIVEYAAGGADIDVYEGLKGLGLKIQQDVMVGGDVLASWGDYTGFKAYVDAGITLMQTDFPNILVPAVAQYNETGVFPESGPTPTE